MIEAAEMPFSANHGAGPPSLRSAASGQWAAE
jgi:hypothetical protein